VSQNLNDTISRSVMTRRWQKLCVRYAIGSDADRRRINDVLGAGDRLHFELAWAATYGTTKPIPQPPPGPARRSFWPRAWRLKSLFAELEATGSD
jgi:hypothetical protein